MDLCVAVASTWKLQNITGLSEEARLKLKDNIFVSFTLISYVMLWGINSGKERREIFSYLNSLIPDLSFSHGIKQRMTTFLYKLSVGYFRYSPPARTPTKEADLSIGYFFKQRFPLIGNNLYAESLYIHSGFRTHRHS